MNSPRDKPRALLAEDTAVGRKVVSHILSEAGFQVTAVGDGRAVLEMLAGSPFDVVVMDCMMPGMDGFQATRAIRDGEAGKESADIPIIALTGLGSEADQKKCIEAGMDEYISKPVEVDTLIVIVQKLLSGKQSGVDHAAQDALQAEEENLLQSLESWSPGSMDTIIEQFLEDVPAEVLDLKNSLQDEDLHRLHEIAHRLRGAAEVLSARTLSSRAMALERAAQAGNVALVRQLGPSLILELEHLCGSLRDSEG